jgi:hypothetical protein
MLEMCLLPLQDVLALNPEVGDESASRNAPGGGVNCTSLALARRWVVCLVAWRQLLELQLMALWLAGC